jgi:hypothetical protein
MNDIRIILSLIVPKFNVKLLYILFTLVYNFIKIRTSFFGQGRQSIELASLEILKFFTDYVDKIISKRICFSLSITFKSRSPKFVTKLLSLIWDSDLKQPDILSNMLHFIILKKWYSLKMFYISPMISKRNRTSSSYIGHALYLYFLGLSTRNVARAMFCLHKVKRSHVVIWKWIQKYHPRKILSKRKRISEFIID